MNATTLSITTMALGVMIGITGTHYRQVNKLVDHGAPARVSPADTAPAYETAPISPLPSTQPLTLASSDIPAVQQRPVIPMMVETGNYREDALMEILASIRNEQRTIRKQLSESNRDLDELTFRVDSHSDSFKPLRTEVERPRPMDTAPQPLDGGGAGLLPPKQ